MILTIHQVQEITTTTTTGPTLTPSPTQRQTIISPVQTLTDFPSHSAEPSNFKEASVFGPECELQFSLELYFSFVAMCELGRLMD